MNVEKKYVKLSTGDVIEATQISFMIQKSGEKESSEMLQIQIDTDSAENRTAEYAKKFAATAISDVNIYSDEDCKNLIFAGGAYADVSSVSATIRVSGLLYNITLEK